MIFRHGLGIATAGALLTEFSGVAGVGELYGLSRGLTLPIAAAALLAIVLTGSYRRVERIAIAVGLFEFAFFFVAWGGAPGRARARRRQPRYPVPQQGLRLSGRGEYWRGHHAVG